jgi:tRNASer (uridine44-2'-O)-methyltransferase
MLTLFPNEANDCEKAVWEDIGIAAYLIALWSLEADTNSNSTSQDSNQKSDPCPRRPLKFLDLGCGNGLLVYLLSCEGFSGKGVDLRRRKTWDVLSSTATLEERAIFPERVRFGNGPAFESQNNIEAESASGIWQSMSWDVECEVEWIIGNHCDEVC